MVDQYPRRWESGRVPSYPSPSEPELLLKSVASAEVSVEEAAAVLNRWLGRTVRGLAGEEWLGRSQTWPDHGRPERTGEPEVVLGESKTPAQCAEAVEGLLPGDAPLLVTRADPEQAEAVLRVAPSALYHADARLVVVRQARASQAPAGCVAVATAGTSDLPVARECTAVLAAFGIATQLVTDVGVTGVHRTLAAADTLADTDVVVAVAGMEGALPTVLAGLLRQPVIAVPTSVGYGASFEGLAALLTMLSSCAPGVSVVNIDNGFGAAMVARRILRLRAKP